MFSKTLTQWMTEQAREARTRLKSPELSQQKNI